jgi:hypothetical protein
VVLGIEARFAADLAHARGVSLDRADAVPWGRLWALRPERVPDARHRPVSASAHAT